MARFIRGEVVVIPFPFSDLSQSKRRPALVICDLQDNDIILCQITSQRKNDPYEILLTNQDFQSGELNRKSYIRPNRIFTADQNLIIYKIGQIEPTKLDEVINKIIEIIS
ncbi:MAG: type II toxin-antitoxin system PemK/MazF family toxin [Crocosphaera sp.]|nr:type II toxin-antitoxin system PemK/MazF family toxin [Crocosphaera sp.]